MGPPCCTLAKKESDELNRTTRDLKILSSKGIKSESANDDGSKLSLDRVFWSVYRTPTNGAALLHFGYAISKVWDLAKS
jgi:hypothetical protein